MHLYDGGSGEGSVARDDSARLHVPARRVELVGLRGGRPRVRTPSSAIHPSFQSLLSFRRSIFSLSPSNLIHLTYD